VGLDERGREVLVDELGQRFIRKAEVGVDVRKKKKKEKKNEEEGMNIMDSEDDDSSDEFREKKDDKCVIC
jgi:hypothetical protein